MIIITNEGEKKINGSTLAEIIDRNDEEIVKRIDIEFFFENLNSEEDLPIVGKKLKESGLVPVQILKTLMVVFNISIPLATELYGEFS